VPESIRIRVPYVLDDPIVGRTLMPLPFRILVPRDYITIDNGILTYHNAMAETATSLTLKDAGKLLVQKRQVSYWDKELRLDLWKRAGIEITLLLIDVEGRDHVLIPPFFIDRGQRTWNRFLTKLSKNSSLQVEEISIPE
jgi:hypothetical protein